MMSQPSQKTSLLIGQISILVISLVTAFMPQYSMYIFLGYFIIIMIVMFRSSRKMSKMPPKNELGAPLFKENGAIKIAMNDELLTQELKKQAMGSMGLLMLTFMVFILFPLYRQYAFIPIHEALSSAIGNIIVVNFLDYYIMYQVIFGILTLSRFLMQNKLGQMNLMIPQKFHLYRIGIVANDRMFIPLTSDLCFVFDRKRHFVELHSIKNKGFRIRLYTDAISELVEKLKSLKVSQCVEEAKI